MTGEQLKQIMQDRGIKPLDLAYQLGVTLPTIYKMMASEELTTLQTLAIKQLFGEK